MADLLLVRTEIKNWERSFKESNGRAPTIDDIKQNVAIANKYKLYKRLSKAIEKPSITQVSAPPSTPTRKARVQEAPSVLLSRTRAVQPTAPLASFNPFSPQKKDNGKERSCNNPAASLKSVLFSTSLPKTSRDPFPPIVDAVSSTSDPSTYSQRTPLPTSAVSKARKRLRGEAVSPSPNRDKRRRISSQTTLTFPLTKQNTPNSDNSDGPEEEDSSFVYNSPIKPLRSGKSFATLFNEELPTATSLLPSGFVAGPPSSLPPSAGHPSKKRRTKNSSNDSSASTNVSHPPGQEERVGERGNPKLLLPSLKAAEKFSAISTQSILSTPQSLKRPLSEDDSECVKTGRQKSPLIPPSPPPVNSQTNRFSLKSKPKPRGRPKKKVDKDEDDQEEVEGNAKLKLVDRSNARARPNEPETDDIGLELDAVTSYTRFAVKDSFWSIKDAKETNEEAVEDIESHLPDTFRRVLSFPSQLSKGQDLEEDRLVQGLLYGRRVTHYDPNKGGEIWDVGENEALAEEVRQHLTEGEDEWEGEPVPWEIGEL